jgi:hypothetical protein
MTRRFPFFYKTDAAKSQAIFIRTASAAMAWQHDVERRAMSQPGHICGFAVQPE